MGCVPAGDPGLGLGTLLIVQREQGSAVLGADVIALAVELRRIVGAHVDVEQVGIGHHGRIEFDPDRLGVAGVAAAHLLVGWVGHGPANIAAFHRADPGD